MNEPTHKIDGAERAPEMLPKLIASLGIVFQNVDRNVLSCDYKSGPHSYFPDVVTTVHQRMDGEDMYYDVQVAFRGISWKEYKWQNYEIRDGRVVTASENGAILQFQGLNAGGAIYQPGGYMEDLHDDKYLLMGLENIIERHAISSDDYSAEIEGCKASFEGILKE